MLRPLINLCDALSALPSIQPWDVPVAECVGDDSFMIKRDSLLSANGLKYVCSHNR